MKNKQLQALWEMVAFAKNKHDLENAYNCIFENYYISMAQYCALKQAINCKMERYAEV